MHMPTTWIATAALMLLAAAIAGGAFTAFARLTDRNTPVDTGLLHGGAGILATALLLFAASGESGLNMPPAVGILALTIVLGLALYFIIRRKGVVPKGVILLHATSAAGALCALLCGLPM
jgi:hypothetical protein